MKISQALQASHELYRQTHESRPDIFRGNSINTYRNNLKQLIQNSNIKTCLDYGCGNAEPWKRGLKSELGLQKLFLYDPGTKEYRARLERTVDLVTVIDVLEHVPENCVDEVLFDISNYANKAIFLSISTKPASKKLVDGSNAHATVKPEEWWREKINKINKYTIAFFTA